MKRKTIVISILIGILCYLGYSKLLHRSTSGFNSSQIVTYNKNQSAVTNVKERRSIFVPHWQIENGVQLSAIDDQYDSLIYFGIAGTESGINTRENEYAKLSTFVEVVGNKPKMLTVGMVNSEINENVLADSKAQQKIISDSISLAKEYDFQGIVFDFEYVSLFGNQKNNVTAFYKRFSEEVKKAQLDFSITLYGDVYYRRRPYDVKKIASYADEVMIMAYDLHKSRGEPGPNFPLQSGASFGYGYNRLFNDILKEVQPEKITVVFGMYGYDWKVDNQGRPITQGESLTSAQIRARYVDTCLEKNCKKSEDSDSGETKVTYRDSDGKLHIIWFEDQNSVTRKERFLKDMGINSYSFWAYGYF